jgi:hypothetical protein
VSDLKTISGFLEQTRNPYRIFDMGRRICKITASQFRQFEEGELAYPYPLQNHAWIGVLDWSKQNSEEQFIWFMKMPLDEAAGLIFAARDDFVYRLLKSLKSSLAKEGQQMEDAMKDTPYGFTPNPERMAVFHAKSLKIMGLPASKYYQHAQEYMSGALGYDQWAFVGMQGIADLAVHWEENQETLLKAIPQLPAQPFDALCKCLENEEINSTLASAVIERLDQLLAADTPDSLLVSAALRGISFSPAMGLRRDALNKVLNSPLATDLDLLVTVAGRCWSDLQDDSLCHAFLEKLAATETGRNVFNQLLADLLYVPGMREPIMAQLRNPTRSPELATAIGNLFGSVRR